MLLLPIDQLAVEEQSQRVVVRDDQRGRHVVVVRLEEGLAVDGLVDGVALVGSVHEQVLADADEPEHGLDLGDVGQLVLGRRRARGVPHPTSAERELEIGGAVPVLERDPAPVGEGHRRQQRHGPVLGDLEEEVVGAVARLRVAPVVLRWMLKKAEEVSKLGNGIFQVLGREPGGSTLLGIQARQTGGEVRNEDLDASSCLPNGHSAA